ncbi:MAG: dienelactone hydrolase family protein [Bradyrhizobium sp.]
MPATVTFPAAVVLMLWCAVGALTADARATPLEPVEFESASQRLVSGKFIAGDRIQGYLAKPDGAGAFPAVVGLHGCAGMHDTTKQRLADELVAQGYVLLLVDSYATRRGIDHACTSSAFATFVRRRPDAYGALAFLARQSFVDPQRVAVVGFSPGLPSPLRRPIRSNSSSLKATCASGRRLRSTLPASRQWGVRASRR